MQTDYARRAQSLVGTRFRPQGRSPQLGLDCLGLVLRAFDLPEGQVRRDYRLRGDHRTELMRGLEVLFRRVPATQRRAGDVAVFEVAPDQLHLAILTKSGFVHADARVGKVVETPGAAPWPFAAVFRRRSRGRA